MVLHRIAVDVRADYKTGSIRFHHGRHIASSEHCAICKLLRDAVDLSVIFFIAVESIGVKLIFRLNEFFYLPKQITWILEHFSTMFSAIGKKIIFFVFFWYVRQQYCIHTQIPQTNNLQADFSGYRFHYTDIMCPKGSGDNRRSGNAGSHTPLRVNTTKV